MSLRTMLNAGLLRAHPHTQRRLEMASAYQEVFAAPRGPVVLRDIIAAGGYLNEDVEPMSGEDALYRAGRRSIVAHILNRLRWSESELLQLGQKITYDELANRASVQQDQDQAP